MTAESNYLNPYGAFKNYINISAPLASQLSGIRKQLLAEIEFSETKSIYLEQEEFTKDSLLKLFEQFKNDNYNDYYLALISDINLSNFLSQNDTDRQLKFSGDPLYETPAFVEFVSPYYKKAFVDFVILNFNFPDYRQIDTIFTKTGFMTSMDRIEAYCEILDALHEIVKRLEKYDHRYTTGPVSLLTEEDKTDILSITSTEFIYCINSLPPDFSSFVREYSAAAINLSVHLPLTNKPIKKEISNNLFLIIVEEDLKKIIRGNYIAMRSNDSGSDLDYSAFLRAVTIATIILLKFSQC